MTAPTFTLDLEDHRPSPDAWPARYPMVTRVVLDWLERRAIRGTFFVVGTVAEEQPDLVREVAARGHELGLHAWRHVPLTEMSPETFRAETAKGKELLASLGGREVTGFRAPTFSLVPASAPLIDVLTELGFRYSSSVLPARSPLFGWPGLPREVFVWPSGLVEFPAPVAGIGPFLVPYLGGVYFRVLPRVVTAPFARRHGVEWTYCHPYDFDADEPFWVVPDAGRWGSRLLWWNRSRMFAKLDRLFAAGAGPPLGERLP